MTAGGVSLNFEQIKKGIINNPVLSQYQPGSIVTMSALNSNYHTHKPSLSGQYNNK